MPPTKETKPEKAPPVESEPKDKLQTEIDRLKSALTEAKNERDAAEQRLEGLQAKQAEQNALLSRIERELALGSTSPLDWDKSKKSDLVERIVNAFKTKAGGDASLKFAHEELRKQFQDAELRRKAAEEQVSKFQNEVGTTNRRLTDELVTLRNLLESVGIKRTHPAEVGADLGEMKREADSAKRLRGVLTGDAKIGWRGFDDLAAQLVEMKRKSEEFDRLRDDTVEPKAKNALPVGDQNPVRLGTPNGTMIEIHLHVR